ncbi:hypothetical protein SAMN06265337_0987 [Hymenobacter gelipurpurascens]|uniref:Erythromycin esterase homolog n=1 Tax=Hymenobacter gelipurpurascens TaxID=89968 RepID=A0A212TDB5_9BACT|nr:hypothetical protein [Hymenobacter gelipurpurascens]SNC63975.1 hypothetical protein SAMN06265337_0987 [Hymenobacter gelipurpurascens]
MTTAFRLPLCSAAARFCVGHQFRQLACTVLAGLLSGTAFAQTTPQAQDTMFTRLVQKNQFALTPTGTQFTGLGWEKLQQDIQKSQLVLIGEDHGMAQIPAFATAVARELKPALYVAEIDKYQAQDVSRLATQPGLASAFNKKYPMALSFYSWAEEMELARYLRTQNVSILGIEQVGIGTPGRFFTVLSEKVKSKPAKAYLQQRARTYQTRDYTAMLTGKYNGITMFALGQSGIDSLRAFTEKESPEARKMVDDFVASYRIYQESFAGKRSSHFARINLMKRNLLAELQPYQQANQPLPKMLFKFGAYHVGQGRSIWGDIYDVGNLAKNLADMHDQKSLHIFVMGKQGTKLGAGVPDADVKNTVKYSDAEEAMIKPFAAQTKAGSAWQIFDLRPLRAALLRDKLKVSSHELEATILGYDYVVIIPETTSSHSL